MENELVLCGLFYVFVLGMLALDMLVFHRHSHEMRMREALGWTAFWVGLAVVFNVVLYFWQGREAALLFLAGYLVEQSLSIDNVFVFLLIFGYFKVPAQYQHKVLFWGILLALILRGIFIFAGVALLEKFHWLIYVFGAILIYTGIKMAFSKDLEIDPEHNPILKLFRRFFPVTTAYEGSRFFVRSSGDEEATILHDRPLDGIPAVIERRVVPRGQLVATPLFVVLLAVETTDVVFAVDSVPAVIGIFPDPQNVDPFIVYTSNAFAILGLRALYFAIAGVMKLFHYLHYGLSLILVFIGAKMLGEFFHIEVPIQVTLSVVGAIIVISILLSILMPPNDDDPEEQPASSSA